MLTFLLPILWSALAQWSDLRYGPVSKKGPIGSLRHLKLEAQEAIEDPSNLEEYADCLLVILDATRRAGFSLNSLILEACRKHLVCRKRTYPEPTFSDDPIFAIEKSPCEKADRHD